MRAEVKSFASGSADCRPQADYIASELRANRPVAVSYAKHALVIKGMRTASDGNMTFSTRNSHGPGGDVQFRGDQLCQIYQAISVIER